MKKILLNTAMIGIFLLSTAVNAAGYGQSLCHSSGYHCQKVQRGQSWNNLFPDTEQRTIVKKANRMNTPLHSGMVIAVPNNLGNMSVMDIAPFPHKIGSSGRTLVRVDLGKLAWGAYDTQGNLVNWGPVSGGRNYCPDIHHGCHTPHGNYTIFEKQGPGCISHKFPLPHGGAHMPYCMHFHGGYALHGSATVPGYNASHGCVRMYPEDAEWLNHNFVRVGSTRVTIQ
ncbi:MAG: L,D-transpeptidase [Candidatus Berkiellales bacterium]